MSTSSRPSTRSISSSNNSSVSRWTSAGSVSVSSRRSRSLESPNSVPTNGQPRCSTSRSDRHRRSSSWPSRLRTRSSIACRVHRAVRLRTSIAIHARTMQTTRAPRNAEFWLMVHRTVRPGCPTAVIKIGESPHQDHPAGRHTATGQADVRDRGSSSLFGCGASPLRSVGTLRVGRITCSEEREGSLPYVRVPTRFETAR